MKKIIAGIFILMSVALALWVSPWWLILATLIGANLVQSAFTGWCPAEILLKKFGVPGSCCSAGAKKP